jgi:predicted Zn-dependent protease
VLFKFGLICEAAEDFKQITKLYPNEAWPKYNLAICLMQLGLPLKKAQKKVKTNDFL